MCLTEFLTIVFLIHLKSFTISLLLSKIYTYIRYHKLQILQTNRQNSKLSRKLLYFHAKLKYYHGNCRLLPDNIIPSQSPYYKRHQKRKKERPTNHSGEPLYAKNPLILSHSSILSPASTQIPMASIGNSRLGRCYILFRGISTLLCVMIQVQATPLQFPLHTLHLGQSFRHQHQGYKNFWLLPWPYLILLSAFPLSSFPESPDTY